MPIDLIQWRISIGLLHSEGPYREMKRRQGRKHQKIRIRSIIGNASFLTSIFLLLSELIYIALLKALDIVQWRVCIKLFWCIATSSPPNELRQQSGNEKACFKRISAVLVDLLFLFAVCLVALHSVVQMLLMLAGDVERNPGPIVVLDIGDLSLLIEILHGAASSWMTIGYQLKFLHDELISIQNIPQMIVRGDEACFREMLVRWLKWAPPRHELPTLECLASALREAREERLAYDLPQKFQERKGIVHTREDDVPQQLLTKSFPPPHIDPRETHPLCGKFATVYSNITNLLDKSVGLQDLKEFLSLYCHPLYPEQRYIDPKIYKDATTTKEVLTDRLFPQFINYLQLGLLEAILERFKCNEGAKLLRKYKGFCNRKRKLLSLPDPLTSEEIEQCHGMKKVRVKVDASVPTLGTVENTQLALTDSTGIEPPFIAYACQNPGCVLLDFLVPSSISHIFHELCEEDLTILANAGILELNIDDLIISTIQQHSTQKGVVALVPQLVSTRSFSITSYLHEGLTDCTMAPEHLLEMAEAVPEESLREVCTATFFRYFSTQIRKLTDLSFYLHIKHEHVGMIMASYQTTEEQAFQVLQHWKEREGQNATYRELLKCVLLHGEIEEIESMLHRLSKGPLAVVKAKAILQQKYVSQQPTSIMWIDAPALPQFNRSFGSLRVRLSWLQWLQDLDYSQHDEMIEPSSPIITVVSPKSFLNAISMKVSRLFILKGPHRCGKTMVLRQFVLYWAKRYTLQKFTLVLLIDTSLFHLPPSTLKDLLELLLGPSVSAEDICSYIEEREGEGVLFILDGVTDHNLAKQGMFHRLTSGQYLGRSTVLMTTTGITRKDWEKEDCTQYELLGLSSTQISQAVISHFSSSEATDFFLYVSSNPDIESILSSPVYLSALLYLFSKIPRDQLPSTWTELFSSLTMLLLKQTFPHEVIVSPIRSSSAVDSLPIEVRNFIERMGKIAFHALRYKTATFNLGGYVPSYHFLATCSTGTIGSPVSEHRCAKFILPLLQHYLASLWIHSQPPKEKRALMSDQSCRSQPQVYTFLAGLSDERSLFRFLDNDKLRTVHQIAEARNMIPDHAVVLSYMTSHLEERFISTRSIHDLLLCQPFLQKSEQLKLEDCYLSDGGISVISKFLGVPGHSTLTSVNLERCTVSDEGAATLATALRINHSLKTLDLSYISDKGAMAIGHALKDNHYLENLKLRNNNIGAAGAAALGDALKSNRSLQGLNLYGNRVVDAGAQALAEGLRENSSLKSLNLWDNKIGDAGAAALGDALKSNRSLEELNLHGNNVGDAGAQALAEGVRENFSLRTLELWRNNIDDAGAAALGEALKSNRSLEELNLEGNSVGDAGAQALAEGVRENSSLTSLQLGWNSIFDTGAAALGDVLKSNRSLEELNLHGNSVGDAGAQALAEGLRENSSLKTLKLGWNNIGDTGTAALGDALKSNRSLQGLKKEKESLGILLTLHGNSVGDAGAQALAEGLRENVSLRTLELGWNSIFDTGAAALGDALKSNRSLEKLDLSNNDISGDVNQLKKVVADKGVDLVL